MVRRRIVRTYVVVPIKGVPFHGVAYQYDGDTLIVFPRSNTKPRFIQDEVEHEVSRKDAAEILSGMQAEDKY